MKKEILSLLLFICGLSSFGQTMEESIVREFGDNLHNLCSSQDLIYFNKAQNLCDKACRVKDKIMEDFIRRSGVKSDLVQTYLQEFHNARKKGIVNVSVSNVRIVGKDEQAYSDHYGVSTREQEAQRSEKYTTVAGEIVTNGTLTYQVQDLYYVRKGQIVKITPYEEFIDQRTGKKKVKVDFSDLVDEHSIEVAYGYSSRFPMNIGVSSNYSYYNIGLDFGVNFSDEQIDFKKHTNYATSTLERGKYYYFLLTQGVYLRWASIDCGVGGVSVKYNYNYESVYTSSSNSEKKNYFAMKPKVTFHIPIPLDFSSRTEKLYISPHVGYMYVPKCSALNCWEIGIGVRFRFETY